MLVLVLDPPVLAGKHCGLAAESASIWGLIRLYLAWGKRYRFVLESARTWGKHTARAKVSKVVFSNTNVARGRPPEDHWRPGAFNILFWIATDA